MLIQLLLHLLTSHERRHELDAVFVIKFFWSSKFCQFVWTLLVCEFPLATSETFSCFVLVYNLNLSHLRMCQCCKLSVGILIFADGK